MNYLIVGGAGYIGTQMSHMLLLEKNNSVVIFDNLSTVHKLMLPPKAIFFFGDLLSLEDLYNLFKTYQFDCIMHFASKSIVAESMIHPKLYYQNNVIGTLNLLKFMIRFNCDKIIFSSSAAVYGACQKNPIFESHPLVPINPYGYTKVAIENILKFFHDFYGLNSISFRYFNVAGAHLSGKSGEFHQPETHLIPKALEGVANDKKIHVFGSDYNTLDGTCIRDYVHVHDICKAHLLGYKFLRHNTGKFQFNLGSSVGYSVLEIFNKIQEITGLPVRCEIKTRRLGDPDKLIANCDLAKKILGWTPCFSSLENIIRTSWEWELNKQKLFSTI